MRKLYATLVGALVALLAQPAWATTIVPGTATSTQISSGISGENLQDTPVTDTMPVGERMKDVTLDVTVTAGSSQQLDYSCEESANGTNWVWIVDCIGGTCTKAVRHVDITALTKFSIVIEDPEPYLRCTFDDAANGSGTITVRGTVHAP